MVCEGEKSDCCRATTSESQHGGEQCFETIATALALKHRKILRSTMIPGLWVQLASEDYTQSWTYLILGKGSARQGRVRKRTWFEGCSLFPALL